VCVAACVALRGAECVTVCVAVRVYVSGGSATEVRAL